ncbi:MAG: type IV pilus biogenesis/stability protein PilW [Gammaproteobacteria bacterium]|nr:type IV pilus biogenesis/stability protein PilW [Gammaproteobacteria bacterium]
MIKIIKASVLSVLIWLTACSTGGDYREGADLKKAAHFNVQLGSGYLAQNKLQLAKKKLTKALEQDPDNALAHSTMALLLEKVGQTEDIESHYEEAMSLDPENSDINNNFGTYLCNRGRFDEAQKLFKKAIDDPYYKTPVVAMINAGKCAMLNSNFELAESFFRRALRVDSRSSAALYYMAELGSKTNRYLMTRAYMQRYHTVVNPSAQSLWVQIQAENALDDKVFMRQLIQKIIKKFPDSDEAGKAMRLMR